MNPLTIAPNVQAAAVAGMLIELLEHFLSGYGYSLPPDMGNALTGLVAVIVAHGWDVLTGQNKQQATNGQNNTVSSQVGSSAGEAQDKKEVPEHN